MDGQYRNECNANYPPRGGSMRGLYFFVRIFINNISGTDGPMDKLTDRLTDQRMNGQMDT